MKENQFEVIVIGGGATGLGVAVEAISRGYTTLLLEGEDFGSGTSSKSTKLIHGGIRYLANLDFALVQEGLEERFYFLNNVPHLAHIQQYLVPLYSIWDKFKFFFGVKLYDLLAWKLSIGKSSFIDKLNTIKIAPQLNPENLIGSAVYYDGQFDDTRMLITLLRTFQSLGGIAHNYNKVIDLIKDDNNKTIGVQVFDCITNNHYKAYAKIIINATGTLTDSIMNIDKLDKTHQHVSAAQGTHLVFNKEIFNSNHALVIPKTQDGRILFVVPWHDKVIVGTTDMPVDLPILEPIAQNEEIEFILDTLNQYLTHKVSKTDIKSIFCGQRPLVKPSHKTTSAKISRKHEIFLSESNLISIVGGKWTIYRLMGEDTINFVIKNGLLPYKNPSITKNLKLYGTTSENLTYPFNVYGSDYPKIKQIQIEINDTSFLHPQLPYYAAEIIYHIRYEMAKTLIDILARRTRALYLDAKTTIEIAPKVAQLMAKELKRNDIWITQQLNQFNLYAKHYLVS